MKKAEIETITTLTPIIEVLIDKLREYSGNYQDKFDNSSERWQESERGEFCQELIDNLDSAADALEEALDCLKEAVDSEI